MKLVRIFVSEENDDGLWSVQFEGEQQNELDKFFDFVNDPEQLHQFFHSNIQDLTSGFFGTITINDAVLRTVGESQAFEDTFYDYAEAGFNANGANLQHLFKPLNNFEYGIVIHQKSKARYFKGWLRLYAIRLAQNCYLVTGGSIKLTADMKRDHLQIELNKLEKAKYFLRENGIDYPEDLNLY